MSPEKRLPDACRICKQYNHIGLDFFTWPEFRNLNESSPEMDDFWVIKPCENLESNGGHHCLPKDRAMIVLMDRLINMGNGSIYHEQIKIETHEPARRSRHNSRYSFKAQD